MMSLMYFTYCVSIYPHPNPPPSSYEKVIENVIYIYLLSHMKISKQSIFLMKK